MLIQVNKTDSKWLSETLAVIETKGAKIKVDK